MYGCFVFIHIVMGVVYGLYYFGIAGTKSDVICVTGQMLYTPYQYNSTEDLDLYLAKPGSENVSE